MKKEKQHCSCEEETCKCGPNCHCHENDNGCKCGDNCTCTHDDHCDDPHCSYNHCDCGEHRHCNDECDCGCAHDECGCGHCHDDEPVINEINLDYLDSAQRLKAEFDNYKRRNADIKKESYHDGIVAVVTKLLPVLDGFHQAKKNISDASVLEGVTLLQKQLVDTLTTFGVEKIECVGQPFDPNLHNAVVAMEVEGVEPDMVVEEYQEGFRMKDKIIRHSVVRISK